MTRKLLCVACISALSGCSTLPDTKDRKDSVLIQQAMPVGTYANEHADFAWLSIVAYQDGRQDKLTSDTTCPTAREAKENSGWKAWDFTEKYHQVKQAHDKTHLRASVFERKDPPAGVVAFGG